MCGSTEKTYVNAFRASLTQGLKVFAAGGGSSGAQTVARYLASDVQSQLEAIGARRVTPDVAQDVALLVSDFITELDGAFRHIAEQQELESNVIPADEFDTRSAAAAKEVDKLVAEIAQAQAEGVTLAI